jgi:D-alanine-D-alanine ligase
MDRTSASPLRVALLAGGDSSEREVSLRSGAQVAAALAAAGHAVQPIDPGDTSLAQLDWRRFDVCFLALHGGAGEDGRIQQWLNNRRIAYTGSGPAASRAAMSKSAAKTLFRRRGVPTPDWTLLRPNHPPEQAIQTAVSLGFPVVVKPDGQGSSLGVGIARCADEFFARLSDSRRYDPLALVERFITGREMTVSVLGRKPLPLLEIVGHQQIFDYESKYNSTVTQYRFQTGLAPMKVNEIQQTAVAAAAALATTGLVRVDLLLDDRQQPWVLEVNTLPGLTDHSLAPRAATEAGMAMPELCEWMVWDALRRGRGS